MERGKPVFKKFQENLELPVSFAYRRHYRYTHRGIGFRSPRNHSDNSTKDTHKNKNPTIDRGVKCEERLFFRRRENTRNRRKKGEKPETSDLAPDTLLMAVSLGAFPAFMLVHLKTTFFLEIAHNSGC